MTSEKDCGDWETKSEHEVNEHFRKNIGRCHICRGDFIENSFVNWHPKECTACHNECRLELSQFEPTPEPRQEPRQEPTPEKNKTYSVAEKKLTYTSAYDEWFVSDDEALEEMWKSGKTTKDIAEKLGRTRGAIRSRMKLKRICEKTGRFHLHPTRWEDEELKELEEMWRVRKSIPEIAEKLGRTEEAILARVRTEEIDKKTGRLRPATARQLDWLDVLGYGGPEPTDIEDAKHVIEKVLQDTPSERLLIQLSELGYDGPPPETNQKAADEIAKREPPTPNQLKRIQKIFENAKVNGTRFRYGASLPTNKFDARKILKPGYQNYKFEPLDEKEPCPDCYGTGRIEGLYCQACRGEGTKEAYDDN